MTIFDSIKYPITDFESARNIFPQLPKSICTNFNKWYHSSASFKPNAEQQLAHLRKLICEYDDHL